LIKIFDSQDNQTNINKIKKNQKICIASIAIKEVAYHLNADLESFHNFFQGSSSKFIIFENFKHNSLRGQRLGNDSFMLGDVYDARSRVLLWGNGKQEEPPQHHRILSTRLLHRHYHLGA
jgi:hypothetical protein